MKNIINEIKYAFSNLLRRITGEITTDMRFVFRLSMLFVFTVLSVYLTYDAIYNKGRSDAEKEILNFRHLSIPELHYTYPKVFIDSEIPDIMCLDSLDHYFNNSTYDKKQRTKTARG